MTVEVHTPRAAQVATNAGGGRTGRGEGAGGHSRPVGRNSPVDRNRYAALVSQVRPEGRCEAGGWDWTEEYGGCLVVESCTSKDRAHIATWHPLVALVVADWLAHEAHRAVDPNEPLTYSAQHALALSRLILGGTP